MRLPGTPARQVRPALSLARRSDARPQPVTADVQLPCWCAPATTAIPPATRRSFGESTASLAALYTRKPGPKTSEYKQVVIIGSGATAVTILPAMAATAA